MAAFTVKKMRIVVLSGMLLASGAVLAQKRQEPAYMAPVRKAEIVRLEAKRVEAEIEVLEREVKGYNKSIRKNEKVQDKMEDKTMRLKYKVVKQLSKMDTTVPHTTTYTEWKLIKAEKEQNHAATQIAKAEQKRQEKILVLGDKTKELQETRSKLSHFTAEDNPERPARRNKHKQKDKLPKDYKETETKPRG